MSSRCDIKSQKSTNCLTESLKSENLDVFTPMRLFPVGMGGPEGPEQAVETRLTERKWKVSVG